MNIGMVSTRFAGLDGVTLESAKVAEALGTLGHSFSWYAGELGPGFAPGMLEPSAHFATEQNQSIQRAAFGDGGREPVTARIDDEAVRLVGSLERFVEAFDVDALVVQNALAIPMQLPLAVAVTRFLEKSGMPAVAHHHDFSWERRRFAHTAVPEILQRCFPPDIPNLAHVVINRDARDALFRRSGIEATVLPNVMDFERGPDRLGDGAAFREQAGLRPSDVILLQPTRIIERKGIEHTIDLAALLADPAIKVVVTHGDDLDEAYWERLRERAYDVRVDLRLAPAEGDRSALADAYAAADLVCFPSLYEGFGNALVEAFFYRRPVFVNRYSVYRRDIAPTGVRCIEIDGSVTGIAVGIVARWLSDPEEAKAATDTNYRIAEEHFSYRAVRRTFEAAFATVG